MTASQHTIAGTVLTMPVKIRKANQHMAMFSVDADAAQRMMDYSGLQVCRYLPGRAIVVLMLMHYIDGDLGQYYEYGTNGQFVVGMEFRPGLPIPSVFTSREQVYPTYSYRDGVLRETLGESTLTGVRYRLAGARVRLGEHPYAKELASLGFPKRALVSSSAANVEMSFGDAQEVGH